MIEKETIATIIKPDDFTASTVSEVLGFEAEIQVLAPEQEWASDQTKAPEFVSVEQPGFASTESEPTPETNPENPITPPIAPESTPPVETVIFQGSELPESGVPRPARTFQRIREIVLPLFLFSAASVACSMPESINWFFSGSHSAGALAGLLGGTITPIMGRIMKGCLEIIDTTDSTEKLVLSTVCFAGLPALPIVAGWMYPEVGYGILALRVLTSAANVTHKIRNRKLGQQ